VVFALFLGVVLLAGWGQTRADRQAEEEEELSKVMQEQNREMRATIRIHEGYTHHSAVCCLLSAVCSLLSAVCFLVV
jgi:hypothetical protein